MRKRAPTARISEQSTSKDTGSALVRPRLHAQKYWQITCAIVLWFSSASKKEACTLACVVVQHKSVHLLWTRNHKHCMCHISTKQLQELLTAGS
mmetsp:Transcript_32616/g.64233  ORF Transcript_32616/g.64233 Transcript_32616/m.64233 type:complete len:94 (+) Transcript_32616:41-322(+)